MSSIGRSGEIARLKDYFSQREDDLEKKHKMAIEDLKKTQASDLEKVQAKSSEAIQDVRENVKEKLTLQDRKHQKEIESLKEMYQRKLEESKRG